MARFVMAQGEMQQKFEDMKVRLLMQIVPVVTKILEFLEGEVFSGDGIESAIRLLVNPLTALAESADEIRGIEQDRRIDPAQDPTSMITNENFNDGGRWVPNR